MSEELKEALFKVDEVRALMELNRRLQDAVVNMVEGYTKGSVTFQELHGTLEAMLKLSTDTK